MFFCFGQKDESSEDSRKNAEIEKQLRADQKRQSREVKILLLGESRRLADWQVSSMSLTMAGAGESGKSTVLKQMRLIHAKGFTPSERKQWKVTIFNNLVHAFQCVQGVMEDNDVEFETTANVKHMELVCSDPEIGPDDSFPIDCTTAFQRLWEDGGVQKAIAQGHEYALHDNLK